MRFHVIAPFHNVPAQATACAFATKARNLPEILHRAGYRTVIEYANEGSESKADEHVVMLAEAERQAHFPHGLPLVGSPGHTVFHARLARAMNERVEPGDFILHTFGAPHAHLVKEFPRAIHVETGVGYLDKPFGAYRIYESEAWRNYHWGLADGTGTPYVEKDDRSLSWVIPMAVDEAEWPAGDGGGDERGLYAVFMGRLVASKGLRVLGELLERLPSLRIKLAGSPTRELADWHEGLAADVRARAEPVGVVRGAARAELLGKAFCALMPTQNVEPFGASGVEAMMTGTPLIASSWGAFTETATVTCGSTDEWVGAIRVVASQPRGPRPWVRERAQSRFSFGAVSWQYRRVFERLARL